MNRISLQAIRHEKLNLPKNPCELSLEYDFGKCVETSVMLGCSELDANLRGAGSL